MADEMTRIEDRINNQTRPSATAISGQPEPVNQTAPAATKKGAVNMNVLNKSFSKSSTTAKEMARLALSPDMRAFGSGGTEEVFIAP